MTRTGCSGCPFAKNFEGELELIKVHEPNLYNACIKLFGKTYEIKRSILTDRQKERKKRMENCEQISFKEIE